MATPRETILTALHARLLAVPASALRGEVLPERVPANSLLILRDGEPGNRRSRCRHSRTTIKTAPRSRRSCNGEACEMECAYVLPSGETFTFTVHAVWIGAAWEVVGELSDISDAVISLVNDADPTKKAVFSLSGISTGTTRSYTLPNTSPELAILAGTQTFTGNKTFSGMLTASGTVTVSGATAVRLTDPNRSETSDLTVTVGSQADGACRLKRNSRLGEDTFISRPAVAS